MAVTTTRRAPREQSVPSPTPGWSWLAFGLVLLGLGAALIAVLGPLVLGAIEYHASESATNQIMGGDVAGLVLMGPLSIAAGVLVWRRHVAGPVLGLGPALYGLYMYSQLALGGDVARYPGNSERFFPLFLALFLLAGTVAIASWNVSATARLPEPRRWVDRVAGWYYLVVAVFLAFGLHLPGLLDAWSSEPANSEYLADPNVFWLVKFMDLGLVVPGLVIAGVGILRRAPWARLMRYAAAGWAALLGSSVAGMAIVMQATSDPAASVSNTVAFGVFAAVGLAIASLVHRPLFDNQEIGHRRAGDDPAARRGLERGARS